MAFYENLQQQQPFFPPGDWDLHSFGLLNTDGPFVMQPTTFLSTDSSTGYLQDALIQWSNRCKRRRMLVVAHDEMVQSSIDYMQDCWNLDFNGDPFENFNYLSQENYTNLISDDPLSSSVGYISNGMTKSKEMKNQEETVSEHENVSPSSSFYMDSVTKQADENTLMSTNTLAESGGPTTKKRLVGTRVAQPFAVVKPGGADGDVTLNDINERILMRPTRRVRHPVGDFACSPCVSAHGPGLSGKAVVALTRIHTQGRGTITIIRTRG